MNASINQKQMFKLLFSFGLLGLLAWKIDLREILESLGSVHWSLLSLATAFTLVCRIVVYWRMHMLLGTQGVCISFAELMKISWISDFGGLFVPGFIGCDALRVYGLTKGFSETKQAISSVCMDRFLGMLSLLNLALLGAGIGAAQRVIPLVVFWTFLGTLILGTACFIGVLTYWPAPEETGQSKQLASQIRQALVSFIAFRDHPWVLTQAYLISVFLGCGRILIALLIALSLNIEVPLSYYFVFVPVGFFLTMVPISFGGWGIQEGSYVLMLSTFGVPSSQAFSLSALANLISIVVVFPGLFIYLRQGFATKKSSELPAKETVGKPSFEPSQ